jgi:hypothetical protein
MFPTTALSRSAPLTSPSQVSQRSLEILASFDVTQERVAELARFQPYEKPDLPPAWGIGLIVGASGTGKSLLLSEFGKPTTPRWDKRSIIDYFDSPERLAAVGLNDVPAWCRPYQALSTGQRFRADLARRLVNDAVVDEYTSVVSRSVAKSASRAMRGYVNRVGLTGLVFATCHHDVEEWLTPDWVIDTDRGVLRDSHFDRRPWQHQVAPSVAEIVAKRTRRTIPRR